MTCVNNPNGQFRSGVAIIQCSGDNNTLSLDNISKISTMNTNSTLRSEVSSVGGRKLRLLRRLKRRAPASDLWSADTTEHGRTVLKVGSEAGSVRSTPGHSTCGTWRMQLSSLSSHPCSATSSVKSGKTLRYDEIEANAQYCSVVDVESSGSDLFKSIVTVEEGTEPPHAEVNGVIESCEQAASELETSLGVTRISVESIRDADSPPPRISLNSEPPVVREGDTNPVPPVFLAPPHFLSGHLGSLPPFFVGPRPPWTPGFAEASTPPIELTRWRLNQSFDTSPRQLESDSVADPRLRRNDALPHDHAGNILTPEDLPRLFPGQIIPPPFTRFDEDYSDDDSIKGCCGSFKFSHSTLIRSFIGIISMVGMACVVVGIVLGALTVSGTTRLTLCLLIIGVGAVLIAVSGIAWRLTSINPSPSTTCWRILGVRRPESRNSLYGITRAGNPYLRVRSPNGRSMHPFAGFLFPEFAWRPPPPSYQASVRETQLQQFFETRPARFRAPAPSGSPPPTYRPDSREPRGSLDGVITELSRPPSYRSNESIPGILIEERPFSRQENPGTNSPDTGLATAATESIQIDERQRLLQQNNLPSIGQHENSDSSNSLIREFVSVIDCSTAVPVGFQVSERNSAGEIQQSSAESADPELTPRKRPYAQSGFQYQGSLPPPLALSSPCARQGAFLVTGTSWRPPRRTHRRRQDSEIINAEVGASYV